MLLLLKKVASRYPKRSRSSAAAGRRRRWPFFVASLVACAAVTAQIIPDAPVVNFRLPMFGDNGYPVWDLRGKQGIYVGGDQVDVQEMRLLVFDDEHPNRVEIEILSPTASMLVREQIASGQDTIRVTGDNFLVEGERWTWYGTEKRVVIDENVKVTFFEELSGILP